MRRSLAVAAALLAGALSAYGQDAEVPVAGRDVPVPKRTKFVSPVFPPEAQARGERGIVVVELLIDLQGKVESADVTRSVPAFDEAALSAVRQWEYEPTQVDGRAVKVRLAVPITFALRLPEVTRAEGVPEMRQGAAPSYPSTGSGRATVVTDVILHPDGSVAEAGILSGEPPFAEAMLQALRTWRFQVDAEAPQLAFEVTADFHPGPPPRVGLKIARPRTVEVAAAPPPAVPSAPDVSPSPEVAASPEPVEPPADGEAASAAPPPDPAVSPSPSVPPAAEATEAAPSPAPAAPASPAPADAASATEPPSPSPSAVPGASPTPPPVEIVNLGPAPSPTPTPPPTVPLDFQGLSTVRDVVLAPGVPDLATGRRPVAPPLARVQGVGGRVRVAFSVDASGSTLVQGVNGPELLKEAARQAVASWGFRRTTAERLFLVASFKYEGDTAVAEVTRSP